MSSPESPDDVPDRTALATSDRSHLYREYGVDRSLDGVADDCDGPPADYGQRRAAVVDFYGGRCGRCHARIDRSSADEGVSLAYLYSVDDPVWALSSLVAVCEACYDLLSTRSFADLDRPHSDPDAAAQFPSAFADPRVAVERVPLSGREAWFRKRLTDRVADAPDHRVNAPARACALGTDASAGTTIAMGEELCTDWTRSPDEPRLIEIWEGLPSDTRSAYAECALDPATGPAAGMGDPLPAALDSDDEAALPVPAHPSARTRPPDAPDHPRGDD